MKSTHLFTLLDPALHAQVESCRRELAGLSAQRQKLRICEVHFTALSFECAGLLQRFCQRCERCHELGAFDGAKRSCRVQRAKYNARCAHLPGSSGSTDPAALVGLSSGLGEGRQAPLLQESMTRGPGWNCWG